MMDDKRPEEVEVWFLSPRGDVVKALAFKDSLDAAGDGDPVTVITCTRRERWLITRRNLRTEEIGPEERDRMIEEELTAIKRSLGMDAVPA